MAKKLILGLEPGLFSRILFLAIAYSPLPGVRFATANLGVEIFYKSSPGFLHLCDISALEILYLHSHQQAPTGCGSGGRRSGWVNGLAYGQGAQMGIATVSDDILIQKFRKGCQSSFEELISRYETKAHNLAMRLTRNAEDAEEVLQDVFVTVYRKIDGFEGKAKFSSWLYRITVNAAFMKLRKRRQDQSVPLEDLAPNIQNKAVSQQSSITSYCDSLTMSNEIKEALESAISKLPDDYRAVFVLRDVDGLSNKEVGQILNLSIPAVKSRLHRSRLMLRKRLRRFYEDCVNSDKIVSVGPQLMKKAA